MIKKACWCIILLRPCPYGTWLVQAALGSTGTVAPPSECQHDTANSLGSYATLFSKHCDGTGKNIKNKESYLINNFPSTNVMEQRYLHFH